MSALDIARARVADLDDGIELPTASELTDTRLPKIIRRQIGEHPPRAPWHRAIILRAYAQRARAHDIHDKGGIPCMRDGGRVDRRKIEALDETAPLFVVVRALSDVLARKMQWLHVVASDRRAHGGLVLVRLSLAGMQ